MKILLTALCICCLTACADTGVTTKVYEGGNVVLSTGADAQSLHFHTAGGTVLNATGFTHSTPIMANGAGTALIIDATGRVIGVIGAGVVSGLLAVPHPAAAATAAVIPAAASQIQGVVHPPVQIINQWVAAHGTPSPSPHHRVRHHRPNESSPKDE